jgi:hypothetical protein
MTLADSILIEKRERLIGQFFTILLIGTVMLGNWNTPCDDFPSAVNNGRWQALSDNSDSSYDKL